jgi:hypothetical protein
MWTSTEHHASVVRVEVDFILRIAGEAHAGAKLTPLRPKNTGRPKAKRDADDATPRQKELADSYESYWNAIDSDAPHADAERLARQHCTITDAEFSKLIYNRNSPVNEITRRRGTFRASPTKRFCEASKN